MKKKILQYLVIVEPDERTGTDHPCYSVFCPTLGLADSGDTLEEALERMSALIRFHLQCLKKEGQAIPKERTEKSLVAVDRVLSDFQKIKLYSREFLRDLRFGLHASTYHQR